MMKWIKILGAALIATTAVAASRNIPLDTAQYSTQGSAPSSPTSGSVMNYFLTSDGFPYWKTSGGSVFGYIYSSSALTNHGVLLGAGTRQPSVMSVASSNTVMVGVTGSDPTFRQLLDADVDAAAALDPAKFKSQNQATILGRAAGAGSGAPSALTATQATAILDTMVGDSGSGGTKGLVPAPASGDATKCLSGAGTYVACAGGGGGSSRSASYVYLDQPNGHGSTATKIRTYSSAKIEGTDATYTSDATNGDKIVIATTGVYYVGAGDFSSGAVSHIGITVNDSATTTNASTPITFAQGKRALTVGESNSEVEQTGIYLNLTAGDYIQAHDNGANSTTDDRGYLFAVYVRGASASEVYVENGNGSGSTVGRYRRWSNARINIGTDITYADSSTAGGSFTINTTGIYGTCWADSINALGMVVNDAASGTDMVSTTYADGKRALIIPTSTNETRGSCQVLNFTAGDIVKIKGDSASFPTNTTSQSYFSIIYLGAASEQIYLEQGNGQASLNTKYRLFSVVQSNTSTGGIALSKSARAGYEILIQKEGLYAFSYVDRVGSSTATGAIDIDGKWPTSSPSAYFDYAGGRRILGSQMQNNETVNLHYPVWLKPGQKVSFASDSNNNTGTSSYVIATSIYQN